MSYSVDNPWIREREAAIALWKVDQNRGYISNIVSSLMTDFLSFSRRQMVAYARMLKACGFTGVQLMETCTSWRACGGYEAVHDKLRDLADAAHAEGMSVTVWCWAAEFSDYGWHDETVVYQSADPAVAPYDDPKVFATFNKYYDIYAELASCADRVIAHFFDPGHVDDVDSILRFARLLFDKFRARNPQVKLGIDTWAAPDDFPERLVKAGFGDLMLMELPFLPTWGVGDKREKYRQQVKKLGCELGSWGWYTCEYESDQGPFISVNDRVVADVYRKTREQGDHVMVPSYWSEMDAYHVVNFFSLYVAGHLLIDPTRSTDELLREAAQAVAGAKNADRLVKILEWIRSARSGDTWNTFWWNESGYVLKTADHAAILAQADDVIAEMEALIAENAEAAQVELPLTTHSIYRLMLPQLHQIRQYAAFSVALNELRAAAPGMTKEQLQTAVNALPVTIPEYNNVIGLWGLPEARVAEERLEKFCRENGLTMPEDPAMNYVRKRRIIDYATVVQRGKQEPLYLSPLFYEGGLPFGEERTRMLVEELCREGVLIRHENGEHVALANWESLRFDFNI